MYVVKNPAHAGAALKALRAFMRVSTSVVEGVTKVWGVWVPTPACGVWVPIPVCVEKAGSHWRSSDGAEGVYAGEPRVWRREARKMWVV